MIEGVIGTLLVILYVAYAIAYATFGMILVAFLFFWPTIILGIFFVWVFKNI